VHHAVALLTRHAPGPACVRQARAQEAERRCADLEARLERARDELERLRGGNDNGEANGNGNGAPEVRGTAEFWVGGVLAVVCVDSSHHKPRLGRQGCGGCALCRWQVRDKGQAELHSPASAVACTSRQTPRTVSYRPAPMLASRDRSSATASAPLTKGLRAGPQGRPRPPPSGSGSSSSPCLRLLGRV
jgi:hypothetical protein